MDLQHCDVIICISPHGRGRYSRIQMEFGADNRGNQPNILYIRWREDPVITSVHKTGWMTTPSLS